MRRSTVPFLILCMAVLGCGVGAVSSAADKVAGKLVVKDILTMPGKPVMLEARLVEPGILRDRLLGGIPLEFFVGGVKVGSPMTGGDGRARQEFTTRMRGNQVIRVRVAENTRVQETEATGNLASWERRKPILFVELAALVEEGTVPVGLPALPLQLGMTSLPAPLQGAAKNLAKLTQYYFNVVYLSRTGSVDLESVREWLQEHEFPQGVPRILKPGKDALVATVEEFKEGAFPNIKGGIGRTRDFAETFAEQRIKVVILSADGEDRDYPRKTHWAKDWLEVRKEIQG